MTIKSVAHVCIKTTDLDATSRFYCDALGMKKHFNFVKNGRTIGFYMKASDNRTFVEVFLVDNAPPSSTACTLSHFCLETDSLEQTWRNLVEAGYKPGDMKMGADATPQFWMKDPNGMDLEFQQYTAESSQQTGRDVEVNW